MVVTYWTFRIMMFFGFIMIGIAAFFVWAMMRGDITKAIVAGADAVMLSGETAVGAYPVQAVRTMIMVCQNVMPTFSDHNPLLDALNGDAALFTRSDEIETMWGIIDPVLQGWKTPEAPPLVTYPRGSWGPAEADALLARDGRHWRLGCGNDEQP
jgi:hypothetical protein